MGQLELKLSQDSDLLNDHHQEKKALLDSDHPNREELANFF